MPRRVLFLTQLAIFPFIGLWVLTSSCTQSGNSERPNVVVILIDATRADHLGCYGSPRPTSPNIDALAARGIVFDEVWAQAPYTRASTASLFTGLYPSQHGAVGHKDGVSSEATTLAQCLHDVGYRTAGFYLNTNVHSIFGFGRGFDHYEHVADGYLRARGIDPSRPSEIPIAAVDDSAITETVLPLIEKMGKGPFFLYLHLVGPHDPYTPPKEAKSFIHSPLTPTAARFFEDRLASKEVTGNTLTAIRHGLAVLDETTLEQMLALYDGEIEFSDQQVGRIVERLRSLGLDRKTIVIVTSDHGEEFLDHGGLGHGRTNYREMLRVPLVIAGPDVDQGRVDRPVRLIDVMPTILQLAGARPPEPIEGVAFTEALHDVNAAIEARNNYAEGMTSASEEPDRFFIRSLRRDRYKLVLDYRKCRKLLFDLEVDPGEQDNIITREPDIARRLLDSLVERHNRNIAEALPPYQPELGDAADDRLRALGYVGGQQEVRDLDLARREIVLVDENPIGLMGIERAVSRYTSELDLVAGGVEPEQLLYGWWDPGTGGCWMSGCAGVRLRRAAQRRWFVEGWTNPRWLEKKPAVIRVSVDGGTPQETVLLEPGLFTVGGQLPPATGDTSLARLDLVFEPVTVPASRGAADIRRLGCVIRSIGLR